MRHAPGIVLALLFVILGCSAAHAMDALTQLAVQYARHTRQWVATAAIPPVLTDPTQVNDRACYEHADCGRKAVCTWKPGVCAQPGRCLQLPNPLVSTGENRDGYRVCGCDGVTHGHPGFYGYIGIAYDGPCKERGTWAWLRAYVSASFGGGGEKVSGK